MEILCVVCVPRKSSVTGTNGSDMHDKSLKLAAEGKKGQVYFDREKMMDWWIDTYLCPPQIGWNIGAPDGYGIHSFVVEDVSIWPNNQYVLVVCK